MGPSHSVSGFFANLASFAKALSFLVYFIGGICLVGYFYDWMLEDFIDSDIRFLYAGIATFFTIIGMGRIVHGFGGDRAEKKAIQRALSSRPPQDGEICAFLGVLEPDGELLRSPFSREQCVQFEYSLDEQVRTGRREGLRTETRFSGFHLCPSHVNSTWGPIALKAYPSSVGFVVNHEIGHAQSFLEHTRFEDAQGVRYVSQVGDVWARLRGGVEPPVSIDVAFTDKRDVGNLVATEEYVPPGVEVCLLARYDARRHAAVWYREMRMSPLDRAQLRHRATHSWVRGVAWGLVFSLLGMGLVLPLSAPHGFWKTSGRPGRACWSFGRKIFGPRLTGTASRCRGAW